MTGSKTLVIENKEIKNGNKICENYNALKPIIFFENCFGIFRFCMKNGQLQPPTWAMKLYSVFMLTLYLIAFVFALRLPDVFTAQNSFISIIDQVPALIILFHYTITMITTSYYLSKRNIEIITNIAELDDQLLKINDISFYKKARSTNIKRLVTLCLLQCTIVIIDMVTQEESRAELIIFSIYFIEKLEIMYFCVFIGMVKCRLTYINDYLSQFLKDKGNKLSVFTLRDRAEPLKELNLIGSPSESNMKIRDLAIMYDKLGIILSLINDVYNFQIFMCLVSTFVYIVITIWTSLYFYKSEENNSGPLLTICIWCFTAILVVAGMCFVCEKLRLARNCTKVLVNQIIMDYDLPKTMRVQAKAFMELIEAWPLRVMIYDMFSVDITLMLKFISVATTYLIVIIQISHFIN